MINKSLLAETLVDMMKRGLRVDVIGLDGFIAVLKEGLVKIEEDLYRMAGRKVKYNSSPDVAKLFFEEKGLPRHFYLKGVSKAAIAHLLEEPIVQQYNEVRVNSGLLSNLSGARTALQGDRLKFRFQEGKNFRLFTEEYNVIGLRKPGRNFILPETDEHVLVSLDWRAIELILFAREAGIQVLVDAYNAGEDLHQNLATAIGITREKAKILHYAMLYSDGSVADQKWFFELYPEAVPFVETLTKNARKYGTALTQQGESIKIEFPPSTENVYDWYRSKAVNYRYSGTVGIMMQQVLPNVSRMIKKYFGMLHLSLFDSILFSLPKADEDRMQRVISTVAEGFCREGSVKYSVQVGRTWGTQTTIDEYYQLEKTSSVT